MTTKTATTRSFALITAATCAALCARAALADAPPDAPPAPPTIGAVTNLLPRGCVSFYWRGAPYFDCGGVFFAVRYRATGTSYVVVADPRLPPPAEGSAPPPPSPPPSTIEQNPPPMGPGTL